MEERLLKLEKSNKRMKKYIAFIHIFLISAVFFGFQSISNKFDVVELNKLILRDNNGLERAVLLSDSTGAVKLRFKDTDGTIRTSLGVQPTGAGYFSLVNTSDENVLTLSEDIANPNNAVLQIRDSTHNLYIDKFGLFSNKVSTEKDTLSVYIGSNQFLWGGVMPIEVTGTFGVNVKCNRRDGSLPSTDMGFPSLTNNTPPIPMLTIHGPNRPEYFRVIGTEDFTRFSIGTDSIYRYLTSLDNDGLSTALFDENSIARFYTGIDQSNNVSSRMYDINGKIRLNLGNISLNNGGNSTYITPVSSIYLFNEFGNSVFYAPQ